MAEHHSALKPILSEDFAGLDSKQQAQLLVEVMTELAGNENFVLAAAVRSGMPESTLKEPQILDYWDELYDKPSSTPGLSR